MKSMRPRSKKRQALYANARIPLVKELLKDNPTCAKCHARYAVDVHELKSRARGGSITDRDNLVVLCRPCHTWITQNPKEAVEQGWSKNSWDD
jgi:5-methylcytosine-specific restriction endonuclease McrA